MLDQLGARGYAAEKIWLVLNRATIRGGVPVADIEERLRVPVRYRIPDDQPLATHTINRGVPLAVSHANSAVGRAVMGFARELQHDMTAPSEQAALPQNASVGPLGWLRSHLAPATRGEGGVG